uniref:C2H2-type domain-containing protein n=1 Tax=Trichogramma kaykai TaxID=54128 RepID=A0ABD2XQC4_9HYME
MSFFADAKESYDLCSNTGEVANEDHKTLKSKQDEIVPTDLSNIIVSYEHKDSEASALEKNPLQLDHTNESAIIPDTASTIISSVEEKSPILSTTTTTAELANSESIAKDQKEPIVNEVKQDSNESSDLCSNTGEVANEDHKTLKSKQDEIVPTELSNTIVSYEHKVSEASALEKNPLQLGFMKESAIIPDTAPSIISSEEQKSPIVSTTTLPAELANSESTATDEIVTLELSNTIVSHEHKDNEKCTSNQNPQQLAHVEKSASIPKTTSTIISVEVKESLFVSTDSPDANPESIAQESIKKSSRPSRNHSTKRKRTDKKLKTHCQNNEGNSNGTVIAVKKCRLYLDRCDIPATVADEKLKFDVSLRRKSTGVKKRVHEEDGKSSLEEMNHRKKKLFFDDENEVYDVQANQSLEISLNESEKMTSIKGEKIMRSSSGGFCKLCFTPQTQLSRHFILKHENDEFVKEFQKLPPKSVERRKKISGMRLRGLRLFNERNKTDIPVRGRSINVEKKKNNVLNVRITTLLEQSIIIIVLLEVMNQL